MLAQRLYDIRPFSLLSGADLHSLFEEILGDPSPNGRAEIGDDFFSLLTKEQSEDLKQLLYEVEWVHIKRPSAHCTWSFVAKGSYLELPVEFFMDENNAIVPAHVHYILERTSTNGDWSFGDGCAWLTTDRETGYKELMFSMAP